MKKIISFFLAVLMIGSLMPVMAFAASSLTISNPDNWEHISKSSPPTLKWNKISSAPGYLVTVKNDATGEYYAEREKVTKNSYSLKNLFKDELGSSEYPRLKIWVGALNPDGTDSGSQDIIYVVVSEYPDVSFDSYSSVTSNSATLTMTVEKDYGSPIEDCGFYIGKSDKTSEMTKYSFADYGSYSATTKGTKTMTVNGLDSNTTYYVKAYAKNGVGQKETSGKSFKTKVGSNTLSLSQNSVSWGYGSGNEANITVTCSGDYTHTIKYSGVPQSAIDDGYDYEWLDVTPNGNILNIRPKRANYALEDRTAVITVTSGSLSKTITVKQSLCTEGSPIISFSRSGKTLKDGDNLGTYKLQNNNMEIDVACSDVRRLYAELVSVSSGKRFDDFVRPDGNNNDMSKISLDMSNLTAGNYKIIIYASNSDTANDYWSQSPFDDKKFELYFSMVDGGSGGGSSSGSNEDGDENNFYTLEKTFENLASPQLIDSHKDYVLKAIKYHIENRYDVFSALRNGKCAIFIFDGTNIHLMGGTIVENGYIKEGKLYDRSATCIVVKRNENNAYEVIYASVASTTADYVRGTNENGKGRPVIVDGTYGIITINHSSGGKTPPYAALTPQNFNVIRCTDTLSTYATGDGNGINIHARQNSFISPNYSANSTGCVTIGDQIYDYNLQYSNFIKLVTGLSKNAIYFTGSTPPNVNTFSKSELNKNVGVMIMDRSCYVDSLPTIFGDDSQSGGIEYDDIATGEDIARDITRESIKWRKNIMGDTDVKVKTWNEYNESSSGTEIPAPPPSAGKYIYTVTAVTDNYYIEGTAEYPTLIEANHIDNNTIKRGEFEF